MERRICAEDAGVDSKNGGKVLAGFGSALETLEGNEKRQSAMVILEFPSSAQATAWYPRSRVRPDDHIAPD